jgi:hypothetical protein
MFGSNDNHNPEPATVNNVPPAGATPLPPSPFMDGSSTLTSVVSAPTADPTDQTVPAVADSVEPPANADALVEIKQQALTNLTPLVGHLDQTPEEKFKTTMMLIQASDNSSLIKEAYQAANQIADEKARAQALLDVVNEINYFTQKDPHEAKA